MEIGLLWYDDDPQRPLEAKIGRAADRYREKYGRLPDTCYVHPQAVSTEGQPAGGIQVTVPLTGGPAEATPRGARHGGRETPARSTAAPAGRGTLRLIAAPYILRHHFWLGENKGS
jgi:hypothetical protein